MGVPDGRQTVHTDILSAARDLQEAGFNSRSLNNTPAVATRVVLDGYSSYLVGLVVWERPLGSGGSARESSMSRLGHVMHRHRPSPWPRPAGPGRSPCGSDLFRVSGAITTVIRNKSQDRSRIAGHSGRMAFQPESRSARDKHGDGAESVATQLADPRPAE